MLCRAWWRLEGRGLANKHQCLLSFPFCALNKIRWGFDVPTVGCFLVLLSTSKLHCSHTEKWMRIWCAYSSLFSSTLLTHWEADVPCSRTWCVFTGCHEQRISASYSQIDERGISTLCRSRWKIYIPQTGCEGYMHQSSRSAIPALPNNATFIMAWFIGIQERHRHCCCWRAPMPFWQIVNKGGEKSHKRNAPVETLLDHHCNWTEMSVIQITAWSSTLWSTLLCLREFQPTKFVRAGTIPVRWGRDFFWHLEDMYLKYSYPPSGWLELYWFT